MTYEYVTPKPWRRFKPLFGSVETYHLAADWLKDCPTVADWGGASGYFGTCLPVSVRYTVVDGTRQPSLAPYVLADLTRYAEPSDGILLRHVLDNTEHWQTILANALMAFRQRLVVITFTPDVKVTQRTENLCCWPRWLFNPQDLVDRMQPFLVRYEFVRTTHPERVYYLERRPA